MKELEAIKARAEAATEGPWGLAHPRPDGRNMVERRGYDLYGDEVSEMIIVDTNPSDAEFIANARTDIPKLLAALEAMEGLHVREDAEEFYNDTDGGSRSTIVYYCGTCVDGDEVPSAWPCLTIQAISEALA